MTIAGDIQNLEEQLSTIERRLTGIRSGVDAAGVRLPYLTGATYTNLKQWLDNTCSAMRISGGAVTASGANEIDVALGKGILKIADSEIGGNVQFDWIAEANIVIAADVTTWVGIEYNGGSPKVKTDTDLSNFNFNTDFILARAYNHGGVVCALNAGSYYSNFQHKVCYRLFDVEGFTRAAGAVIADAGNLDFSISEGRFYCGTTPFTFSLWDCSGADRFTYWYRDGGVGWTSAGAQADIDPDHYDDGDGVLGNLSANRYGVHWVYICHDDNVHVQFGQGDYKLYEAEAAQVPTGPDFFIANAKLAGKIIVKVGAGVLTDVLSAFEEVFIGAAASDHEELGGLLGGAATDHYHLKAVEHGYVSGVNAQSLLTIATPTFDDLTISTPVNIYALSHDAFADFDADKHVAHSGVDVTAGTGLTGGGDISATRTINVDVGIGLNKIPPITVADVGDDDYARFTATGLEGRHPTELLADCSAQAGAAFDWNTQAIQNIGDIQAAGHIGLADGAVDPDFGIHFEDLLTDTDDSMKAGIFSYLQLAKTAAAMASFGYSIYGALLLDSSNTQNWTAAIGLRAIEGLIQTELGSAGIITGAASLMAQAIIANAATVTNLYGLYVDTPTDANSKVTNEYGIYIASQNTGATLNYALYTNDGLVQFGDYVQIGPGAGVALLEMDGGAGSIRDIRFQSGGVHRWIVRCDATAEAGANAGSDFLINPRDDAGDDLGYAIYIERATGYVGLGRATPGARLHIYQASGMTAAIIESDDDRARLTFDAAAASFGEFYFAHAGAEKWAFSSDDANNQFGIWDFDGLAAWHTIFKQGGEVEFAGNVGIGISPVEELHVYKSQNSFTRIRVDNPNAGATSRAGFVAISENCALYLEGFSSGYGAVYADTAMLYTSGAHALHLGTGGARRVTIGSAGEMTCYYDLDLEDRMPQTTSKARAQLSADQNNIADSVWTNIVCNSEDYDPGADFNAATGVFTAPVSGYYLVAVKVMWHETTATKSYYIGINHNGSIVSRTWKFAHTNGEWIPLVLPDVIYCAATETLALSVFHNTGAATPDITGGNYLTSIAIHLLSSA